MAGTEKPQLHEFSLDGRCAAILDTPGFDDTYKTDAEVLESIAEFLSMTYRKNLRLSGIIYLQRITDPRMNHSGRANLLMFRALCGDDPLRKVVLATTFWGETNNPERAKQHEEELRNNPEYWGEMLSKKATMTRFHDTQESALEILRGLLVQEKKISLKIQEEMVDQNLDLANTSAGETLSDQLSKMAEKYAKDLERHKQDLRSEFDHELQEVKQDQLRRAEIMLQKMRDQQEVLNANRRDELRDRDMLLDAQEARFRKAFKEQEVSLFLVPYWRHNFADSKAKHLQTEAVERLEAEIQELKTAKTEAHARGGGDYDKQIAEKEKTKMRRAKVLEIFGAVGTTATAAGLSVINPLAIPVAFAGLINIINSCFNRRDRHDATEKTDRKSVV